MKKLDVKQMEQVEGGSCGSAIAIAVGTALLLPETGGASVAIGAALLGAGNGWNVGEECFG